MTVTGIDMALCLQQEINLSRRACLLRNNSNTDKNRNIDVILNVNYYEKNILNNENNVGKVNKCSDENSQNSFNETENEFSNGAKKHTNKQLMHKKKDLIYEKVKISQRNDNENYSPIKFNEFNLLYNEQKNLADNGIVSSAQSMPVLFSLPSLPVTTINGQFYRTTSTTIVNILRKLLLVSRNNKFLILLICVLLMQCSFVAARPNLTSATQSMISMEVASSTEPSKLQEIDGHEKSNSDEAHSQRYPVFTVDFMRVELPFVIGIWILFASVAKIGKS